MTLQLMGPTRTKGLTGHDLNNGSLFTNHNIHFQKTHKKKKLSSAEAFIKANGGTCVQAMKEEENFGGEN